MWPSVSRTQLGGQFFLDTPFWSHKIGPSYYWTIPKWWSIVLCHIQMGMYPHPIKWYNSVWWIFSYTCHFGPLDVAQNYWSPFCDSWRVTYTYVLWVHSYQWGISYSTQYCKSVTLMFARLLMKSLIHAQKNMMIPWWNHQSISIPKDPISGKLSHPRDFIFQDFSSEPLPINGQRSPVDGSNMWKIPYLLAVKSPICAKRVCPQIRYCTYNIDCHCWLSMFPMFCNFSHEN